MRYGVAYSACVCIAAVASHASAQSSNFGSSRETTARAKQVVAVWERQLAEEKERRIRAIPEPAYDDKLDEQLKGVQAALRKAQSEEKTIAKRLELNREKKGSSNFLVKKDEARLKETADRIAKLEEETKQVESEAKAAKAKFLADAQEFRKSRLAGIESAVEIMRYNEQAFLPLDTSDLPSGIFGRIPPFDQGSLKNLTPLEQRQAIPLLLKIDRDQKLAPYEREILRNVFGTTPTEDKTNVRVLQVIDKSQAIVSPVFTAGAQPRLLWIITKTEGMTDDSTICLDGIFMALGTKTYTTSSGSSRTIPQLIKVSSLKKLMQDIAAEN